MKNELFWVLHLKGLCAKLSEQLRDPGVAQMVARLNGVQEAAGSNPVTRTKTLKSLVISAFSFIFLQKNRTLDFYYFKGESSVLFFIPKNAEKRLFHGENQR